MATSTHQISAPFVAGLDEGEVRYQACDDCGAAQTLPRYACRKCGGTRLAWKVAKGDATVFATTVVNRAPSDEFRPLAPYTLALVDLAEGPRLMAHAEPGVKIGDAVTATFFRHGDRTLLRFKR